MEVPLKETGDYVVSSYFQIGRPDLIKRLRRTFLSMWKTLTEVLSTESPNAVYGIALLVLLPGGGVSGSCAKSWTPSQVPLGIQNTTG